MWTHTEAILIQYNLLLTQLIDDGFVKEVSYTHPIC